MTKGEETIDGTKYITFSEATEYKTYADMEKALLDMEYPDMDQSGDSGTGKIFKSAEIKKAGGLITGTYSVKLTTNAQDSDGDPNGDDNTSFDFGSSDSAFKLYIEISIPGKIISYRGGKASGGMFKSEITSLSKSVENEVSVTSETTNFIFIIVSILIILIIFAAFILLARRW